MISRRNFSLLSIATVAGLSTNNLTAKKTEYKIINNPISNSNKNGKVDVLEFFWYKCIHCYNSNLNFTKWAQQNADKINFQMVPVYFRDFFEPQQRLFYTLEAMNALNSYHHQVFTDIFEKNQKLDTQQEIYKWVAENTKLDSNKFSAFFESMPIAIKSKKARELTDQFAVASTPSFGVAGKYYVDSSLTQPRKILDVVNELISKK